MDPTSRKLEPVLSRLTRIDRFSRVGMPESTGDTRSIEGYLSTLGRQGWRIRYAHSLKSVKPCTKLRFDPGWFDAEEEYRQQLIRSTDPAAYECINLSLKSVIDRMSDPVMEAADRNLEGGDLQILKVAAGCAVETCYQYALESAISPGPLGDFQQETRTIRTGPMAIACIGTQVRCVLRCYGILRFLVSSCMFNSFQLRGWKGSISSQTPATDPRLFIAC